MDRRLALALAPEAVRLVGAAGEPAFQNGWVNFGGARQAVGFYKDPLGRVHLFGTVKNGAGSGTTMFTLPAGYRPGGELPFAVARLETSGDASQIDVRPGGGVFVARGSAAEMSLNNISFRAVQ